MHPLRSDPDTAQMPHTAKRTDVIESLRETFSLEASDVLSMRERLEFLEENAGAVAPTIGTEIEVPWSALVSSADYERYFADGIPYRAWDAERRGSFSILCSRMEPGMRLKYDASVECGIPAGRDAFHEFASMPCSHYETMAEEIRLLRTAGLLGWGNPEARLPFHITLGGILPGREAWFLMFALETTSLRRAGRIRDVVEASVGQGFGASWARKGKSGIRSRYFHSYPYARGQGGSLDPRWIHGTELRTLLLPGNDRETRELLRAAWVLGTAIRLKRIRKDWESGTIDQIHAAYKPQIFDPEAGEAIEMYEALASACEERVNRFDISLKDSWGNPVDNPEPWRHFADFLDHPNSEQCSSQIRLTVIGIERLLQAATVLPA